MAERSAESTRAFHEIVETDFFSAAAGPYKSQTTNLAINGQAHLIVSAETNEVFALKHLIQMKLSFDKANVPFQGRMFAADPVVGATLNGLVTVTHDVTPFGQSILETGMTRDMQFIMNLYGWNIITSNRLFVGDTNDGTTGIVGGVFNMFMNISDDQTKSIMHAVRRQPKVEGERNKDLARDEFVMRARYGFGVQRIDTMGCLVTSPTNF